ncbi:MAG: DUF3828 domain-containing protein [Candidatus Schekmanbacteria bacterium]|nr:DUF3828 domain-containing protein [Candidatus Schekmanbacteria bacterium]
MAIAIMLTTACRVASPRLETPGLAAAAFYAERLDLGFTGLPGRRDMRSLAPRISRRLASALAAARREQETFASENPGEKPPWIEGDLFSSLFEGPTAVSVGDATLLRDRAEVVVELTHVSPAGSHAQTRWTDKVLLVLESGQWRVDDIEYGGVWDFAAQGRLVEALQSAP